MREPVHEAPGRHGRLIVVERARVEVGDAAHQHSFDARAGRLERRIFRSLGEQGPRT